jgi:hypothetical protein
MRLFVKHSWASVPFMGYCMGAFIQEAFMAAATKIVTLNMTVEQIRHTYQALSDVPTECRRQMLALFDEHHADWKYQLPDDARFRVQQLEDRETWACQAMGILAAAAGIEGFPVAP